MSHSPLSQEEGKNNFEEIVNEFKKSIREKQKDFSLKSFQNFKTRIEQCLKKWHESGEGGRKIGKYRSDFIDILITELLKTLPSEIKEKEVSTLQKVRNRITECLPFCIIALGGYGRAEMNPYSDIDIMFLYKENKVTPSIEKRISTVLMTLWDLGFKIGHATRSLNEAIEHAQKEMFSKTAMMESRLVTGDIQTFKKFKEHFYKKCIQGGESDYISWRLRDIEKMHEKFGKTVFMQEPHIKSGKGGLRDYQNLLWIAAVYAKTPRLADLVALKFLRESEKTKLENDYDFLLRVRNEMHYQEKRSHNQLTLRLQGQVAKALGYSQRSMVRRSEAFMKDYYEKTREIYLITSLVLDRMKLKEKKQNILSKLFKIGKKAEKKDGFLIKKGFLFPQNREIFNKDPARMMRLFYLAQTHSLHFSPELSDLVKRRLLVVDDDFRNSKENRNIFLIILSRKGEVGRILRLMHDLGFLGKYIPEFGALTCLVQHEFFHLYTADEHTLVCIEKIDELLFTNNKKLSRYSTLFKNLDDPAMLYLGMLLHDVGKAANVRQHATASAVATEHVAERLKISGEQYELLRTLVIAHGELATVARTRDLDDFVTISDFAKIVQNLPTLHALMILTLADGMGTSDSQWSDWKEQLVWNLYEQTKRYLEVGAHFFQKNRSDLASLERKVRTFLEEDFSEEITAHFEQMPARYFRMMEPELISEHLQLFRVFFQRLAATEEALNPEIRWIEHPERSYTEVWICGWDRNRLLEKIAASFLVAGINILSADIFTRKDYLTLDIFRVTSVRKDPLLNEKEKRVMQEHVRKFLSTVEMIEFQKPEALLLSQQKVDLDITAHVTVDNKAHPTYTIIDVETADRQGLFYDLLEIFHQKGISIDLARIATEMRAAFDTFYVLGPGRKKMQDPLLVKELQLQLLAAAEKSSNKTKIVSVGLQG